MLKLVVSVFVVGSLFSLAQAQDKPPLKDLKTITRTTGSVAADFAVCQQIRYARRIRQTFGTMLSRCTDDIDIEDQIALVFDKSFTERLLNVSNVGGVCQGGYKKRYFAIRDLLISMRKRCRGK